jgi:NAD(P)-dependent dehydrogenase (short-subunit alcohol dehydrogenase family)
MGILDRFSVAGQVEVVTGGRRGIGEGIALRLAEAARSRPLSSTSRPMHRRG